MLSYGTAFPDDKRERRSDQNTPSCNNEEYVKEVRTHRENFISELTECTSNICVRKNEKDTLLELNRLERREFLDELVVLLLWPCL